VTTFRIEAPSSETEDSPERIVGKLLELREAGVDLCVLAVSPTRPETLSWVAEAVVPRLEQGKLWGRSVPHLLLRSEMGG
jgi:hypothetical protein